MNDHMKMLGLKVEDKVTGFRGVVSCVSFDLYGCVQMAVTPEIGKDGKKEDGAWFDAKRLTVLSKTPVMDVPQFASIAPGKEIGAAPKPPAATHTS